MNILQQTAIFAQWLDRLADLKGKVRIAARINAASKMGRKARKV